MPESIIQLLEPVKIQHEECHGQVMSLGFRPAAFEHEVQPATIRQPGQLVGPGGHLQLPDGLLELPVRHGKLGHRSSEILLEALVLEAELTVHECLFNCKRNGDVLVTGQENELDSAATNRVHGHRGVTGFAGHDHWRIRGHAIHVDEHIKTTGVGKYRGRDDDVKGHKVQLVHGLQGGNGSTDRPLPAAASTTIPIQERRLDPASRLQVAFDQEHSQ